jgi:hypothetical protein
MPDVNPLEAARTVAGELPDLPHLVELPTRGPGADMIGRAAALLIDIPVEVTTRGWRIAERPGRDLRRAKSMLSADLDAMEEVLDGYAGPLKIQLAGPWTLAGSLEQPHSLNKALTDPGLVADLAASLAEGAAAHVAEIRRRVPGATLLAQLDEPMLPFVAAGRVPTPSGLSTVRAVEEEFLRDRLRQVLAATGAYTIVHCCAREFPFATVTGAGADAVSFDLTIVKQAQYDDLAETAEAGKGLLTGVLQTMDRFFESGPPPDADQAAIRRAGGRVVSTRVGTGPVARWTPADTAKTVRDIWRRLALPPASCAAQVVLTPTCGLSDTLPAWARGVLRKCREAASILPELMEELT